MFLRKEITDNPSNKFKERHLGPFSTGTNSPAVLQGDMEVSSGREITRGAGFGPAPSCTE